jgi:hypothetical protein
MKLASKMMAVAVLALVAGSVSAATTVVPSNTAAGTPVLITVTDTAGAYVNGTSIINFGAGNPLATTFVDANTLTATLLAADVLVAKTVTVSVTGPGAGNVGVFYVTDDALEVTINVTVTVPTQVVLFDDAIERATQTWTLAGSTLATQYASDTDSAVVIKVRNKGGAAVKIQARLTSNGSWSPTTATANGLALNEFWVNANAVELDNTAQDLIASILPGATTANTVLTIRTPATVSTLSSGNIVVQYTATPIP